MAIIKRILGLRLSGEIIPGDVMNWLRETGASRPIVKRAVLVPPKKARASRATQRTMFDEDTLIVDEPSPRPPRASMEPPFEPGFYRRRAGVMSYAKQEG